MRRERPIRHSVKTESKHSFSWIKLLIISLMILIAGGLLYRDYKKSQVVGSPYRYNLVLASESGDTSFVSFDPEEKLIYVIPLPPDLEIKSRSVGTYKIGNLYKLGGYEGRAGELVRRKVQGFMKVPVAGYIETQSSQKNMKVVLNQALLRAIWRADKASLSRLDSAALFWHLHNYEWREGSQEELVRAGVLEKKGDTWQYSPERLAQFLGVRVFDWAVGGEDITVAIVNNSGVDGLGADIAEFMTNLGFDVVSVKSGIGGKQQETTVIHAEEDSKKETSIAKLLFTLFGWKKYSQGSTDEYRAELVVTVGTDAIDLF